MLRVVFTGRFQAAFGAFGRASDADIAAVQDQPVVRNVDLFGGNEGDELPFGGQWRFGVEGKADPRGDAEDMGIDGHIRLFIDDGGNDVGCFAADAGQAHQFFDGQRNFAAEFIDQHAGHADQMFRFVIWIGNAANKREQLVKTGLGKRLRIREVPENCGRRHIDPLVRALRREDYRYQKLIRGIVQ